MLIDAFLPEFDFNEVHSTEVDAPVESVYASLMAADLRRPFIIRLLTTLRSLPSRLSGLPPEHEPVTLRTAHVAGFTLLGEEPPREVVVGTEGRFWHLVPDMCAADEVAFDRPVPTGVARAVWNFTVEPRGDFRSSLRTETRIKCGDEDSRRRFARYWRLVRPGSGLIRRAILAQVASEVRASPALGHSR